MPVIISPVVIASNIMIQELQIRTLLKKTENNFISEKKISYILNVNKQSASEVLKFLDQTGYIEKTGIEGLWQQSLRGKILLYKKLFKEFKVDTLKRQLNNLLKRIDLVNSSKDYPSYVSCAIVTSEYPIENKAKGVYVVYSLSSKNFSEKEYNSAARKLRKRFKGNFSNIVEYHYYPHTAIRVFLKSSSPVLKLEECRNREIGNILGYRLIEQQE